MLKTLLIKFIGANRQKNYEKLTKYINLKIDTELVTFSGFQNML